MHLDTLPTEILTQIYLCLPTVSSATSLSATCLRMHSIYHSSKRFLIITKAAEVEFGPLNDIIQLVTHNATQPAHVERSVGMSDALLGQIVQVGRVAQKWAEIFPLRKWKDTFADRRLLSSSEARCLRQALYRLWLFDRAFHTSAHTRTTRLLPGIMRERAALLHNFSAPELADMLDVHLVLRDVIANNVCPSNGKMRARFHKRYQDHVPTYVNIHLNYPRSQYLPDAHLASKYHGNVHSPFFPDVHFDGWGDDIMHYYVVEDMMKLDPSQVLFLREQHYSKHQVESYVADLGEWFGNNGEVFSETLAFVMKQRGHDIEEMKDAILDGDVGICAV